MTDPAAAGGYQSSADNDHERDEEYQWTRILAGGHPVAGMVLVFVQKLCTAFHEFDPAWRAGAISENDVGFFRERLTRRIDKVLEILDDNGLADLPGRSDLAAMRQHVQEATTNAQLASQAEPVHMVNHTLCDALEVRFAAGPGRSD